MVTIVDYITYQRESDGKNFHVLVVQGGLEAVKSKVTNKNYFTARTAKVPCTFDEITCKNIIGTQMHGSIQKVATEPYEYTVQETGEVVELSHRYEYVTEENVFDTNLARKEEVIG